MDFRLELLTKEITEFVQRYLETADFDINKIAQTTAVSALGEIQKVIKNNSLTDFEMVEEIVCIFEKYNINCGVCHDF